MVLITSINARQIRLPVARRPETCAGARQPTLIVTRPGNRIEVQGCNQIRYRHITGSVQSRQLLSRAASKHALDYAITHLLPLNPILTHKLLYLPLVKLGFIVKLEEDY